MKRSFAIGIPTLNRYDLLKPTLEKYYQDYPGIEIHIVDNGDQNIIPGPNTTVHVMARNLGVAASWNFLCKQIFKKHTHALILNDDIYLGIHASESLQEIIKEDIFTKSMLGYCCFLLPRSVYFKIGPFDEKFYPAYFEDNDYNWRVLNGRVGGVGSTIELNPNIFNKSMTLQKDRSINDLFKKNQEYYIQKWGGLPGQEKYLTPFDQK